MVPGSFMEQLASMVREGQAQLSKSETDISKYRSHHVRAFLDTVLVSGMFSIPASVLLEGDGRMRDGYVDFGIWMNVAELRRRISFSQFWDIRNALSAVEGFQSQTRAGQSSLSWRNPRTEIPSRVLDLARSAASISREYAIQSGTSFVGIDDDQLRYASTRTRKQAFKPTSGKKGAGIHCTALVSTVTGISGGLHFSIRSERVETTLASLSCAVAGLSSESRALLSKFENLTHSFDQAYATKGAFQWVLGPNVDGRLLCSHKKTAAMPIKAPGAAIVEGQVGYVMPSSGIRESATFRLQELEGDAMRSDLFVTGYRDVGDSTNFGLVVYHAIPGVVEPHLYTLRLRYKQNAYRRVREMTHSPKNILPPPDMPRSADSGTAPRSFRRLSLRERRRRCIEERARAFLLAHELRSFNLLTEGQTDDQVWWLLRTAGITSTAIDLLVTMAHTCARSVFCSDPMARALLRALGVNIDNARYSELQQAGLEEDTEHQTLREFVDANAVSVRELEKKRKDFLLSVCSKYGISCRGTKRVISERIWEEAMRDDGITPLTSVEQMRNQVVERLDAHMFHKPFKGTEYTAGGHSNELNIVKAAAVLFEEGENERVAVGMRPGERLVFACLRGLVQSKYCSKVLASPDALGVIWCPLRAEGDVFQKSGLHESLWLDEGGDEDRHNSPAEERNGLGNEDDDDEYVEGTFSVVVIEAKTLNGQVARARIDRMRQNSEAKYVPISVPVSDITGFDRPLNVEGDDPAVTDPNRFKHTDEMLSAVGNRKHCTQLFTLSAGTGIARTLYVVGSPNRTIQMVDISQELTTRAQLEAELDGFTLAHGDGDVQWPCYGLAVIQMVMKFMNVCGARVLFDGDGRHVPGVIEDASYIQTRVARIQHAQLVNSAMKLATAQIEPAPNGKYFRHSSIFLWNNVGKAGVDETSRKANSMVPKALTAELPCRLSLRVLACKW